MIYLKEIMLKPAKNILKKEGVVLFFLDWQNTMNKPIYTNIWK